MSKKYPKSARLGELPNEHGAYTCPPDLVHRWDGDGMDYMLARLLKLEDGTWLHSVGHYLRDGGQDGPIWYSQPCATKEKAIEGACRTARNVLEMAAARGVKGLALANLERTVMNMENGAPWYPPEPADTAPQNPRGRKPVEPEIIDTPKIDEAETSALIVAAAEWDRNARALATQIGYSLPADSTNPDLICRDIAANMRRSVEAVLDIGRGLLVLKSVCGHGDFLTRLESIGIEDGVAQRFMQAARKFSNAATSRHLLPAISSQSKLFELLILDDEQIDELAETGQTGELKLDDVACMGVRELRKAVRELRGKVDAKDKVAQNNQKTINDLQERLVAREEREPEDEEDDDPGAREIDALNATVDSIEQLSIRLNVQINALRKTASDTPARMAHERSALMICLGAIRSVAQAHDIPLAADTADEEVEPEAGEEEIHRVMAAQLRAHNEGKNNEAAGA